MAICNLQLLQFTATPIQRIEGDKSVIENDVIFCIPNFFEIEDAKNDIVFPIFNFFEIGN